MLQKRYLVSIFSIAALGLASLPAYADTNQTSTQVINQNAAAVGDENYIYQRADQINIQNSRQRIRGRRSGGRVNQDNAQFTGQSAGAVNYRNSIEQRSRIINTQRNSIRRDRNRRYSDY
ncbi:hypothetical protein ACX27_21505 [Nostoc piscinale CENA21]|uniref:Uncharacterized protein n=1 Tax=Nostoc piscinale CENA21 TaxID=224013 RepID=A0A0M3V605_9NOSO|nr:hypothetical protein [Nostoc piscinale]ALF54823.1 hypothetical protein ACX27_21505 [Nostoc piscinale CENA21]